MEIHTHDGTLVGHMLGSSTVSAGDRVVISDQATLIFDGSYIRKAAGLPEIARFTLDIGTAVAASLAANWLYDKLKGRRRSIERLTIERTEIEIEDGEIRRVIEERLTRE